MAVRSHEMESTISTGDFIANEIPSGSINSSNKNFSVLHDPIVGTVIVVLNGLTQIPGSGNDYTISGKIITFAKAPRTNSELLVHYFRSL